MTRTTLRGRGQLTLPDSIRRAARLEEGDTIEVEITMDGILLRPLKTIDATQAWFWTGAWQEGEREAEAAIARGDTEVFGSGEEMLDALRKVAKPAARRK